MDDLRVELSQFCGDNCLRPFQYLIGSIHHIDCLFMGKSHGTLFISASSPESVGNIFSQKYAKKMAKDFSKCQLPKKSSDLFFNVSRESSKRHRAHSETFVKFLSFTDSGRVRELEAHSTYTLKWDNTFSRTKNIRKPYI